MTTNSLIDLQVQSGIATLYFNRPEKRNAMSDDMRTEFIAALERVASDKAIRALVITGNGKGFCAGGDIWAWRNACRPRKARLPSTAGSGSSVYTIPRRCCTPCPRPTIAAVNGAASGLGADTALACDFIVASENASFTWSYINRGIIPDGGGMYFLPRRVGLPKAKELIFSGRKVDASEALQIGIADRVESADGLLAAAQAWAAELSKGSSTALALGKTILDREFRTAGKSGVCNRKPGPGHLLREHQTLRAVMAFLAKSAGKA